MATYDEILRSLPEEVRGKFMKSSEGMTPGVLKLRFGLVDIADVQREPRTGASKQAAKVATDAMRAWTDIHSAHWSSMADATVDKRAAFLRSAQFAKKQLARINADYDAALTDIEEKAAYLQTVLGNARKPPTSPGDAAIDAEVRALVRAQPDAAKALSIAHAYPRAFATAPASVSGLSDDAHAALVREHLQAVEPDALADQDDLRGALTQITTAQSELSKQTNALIDFDTADKMGKHAQWQPPTQEAA